MPISYEVSTLQWDKCWVEGFQRVSTSVLKLLSPVVGAVLALQAEVDVGADAAVV